MEGMMVGTVSYMPPEQAGVGEVTPKSDLYSLGAMIYEMVTGRPPFVGDDSVSVIGQHINTPPISPTWHRADLPPAFESLIMLLLEKEPEKRPASAKDVLAALESIEKGDINEQTVETQAPTENPMYRQVFVGRENELKTLQNAFTGAMSGQGALMMVVGEPGIGKTSVCAQLSTFVTLRGGKTLWGYCYEEGSLSLPYLAFVEAMRSYVMDREPEDLQKELGSGATDVARIVSEVREKLHVEPREAQNPEEDRYRLMQAVTSFLANAAAVKPMLVILEDLHDADKGTLEMLSYVSRNLDKTRLLIVGTYRDVEVDRAHPLSASLAELRRSSNFGRVLLRGLNVEEVGRMLVSITQQQVPAGFAQAIHRQTEGNPLFVQEVVRYLMEEKLLVKAGTTMIATGSTPLEMSIPEGLRDVIGKRLSALSEECNRVLSIAAVIGRDFRLDVLQKVAEIPEEEVLKGIEEAKSVGIIEERTGVGAIVVYRFAHAFFRTILYEENIAPRRIRLHNQVARVLEEVYASRLSDHAAELAEHFSYSNESEDLAKAVSYGEMAARRATDVFDYGEAVRLLQQALKVQEVLDPDDKAKRCNLLSNLGRNLTMTPEIQHAIDIEYPQALSLADEIGDRGRAAMICVWTTIAIASKGMETHGSRELLQWAEKADRYAEPDTIERGWADYRLGWVRCVRGNQAEGVPLLRHAFELARKFDNRELLGLAGGWWLQFGIMPWSEKEESLQVMEELVITENNVNILLNAGFVFYGYGLREKGDAVIQTIKEMAATTGEAHHIAASHLADCTVAFYDGRLEETVEILEHDLAWRREVGLPESQGAGSFAGFFALDYLYGINNSPDTPLRKAVLEQVNTPVWRRFPFLAVRLGQVEEANRRLDRMIESRPHITSTDDMTPVNLDIFTLESAVLVGHRLAIELLLRRFTNTTLAAASIFGISRLLGAGAAFLEKYEEAREHYKEAIRFCTEIRFRPELALSRLGLAELLLDHYPDEKAEALEHLDFAIKEFR
ncbi:MAG: AAA family ATPase, partial [Dehalococcoidales bacterium]